MSRNLDLTGQTFGRLTALKVSRKRDRRGRVLWECQCTCGKKKNVATGDLKASKVKSCGCAYREDLTNRVFGRLTVVKATKQRRHNNTVWLCRCKCGKKVLVRGNSLTSSNTRSCGCYNRDRASEVHRTHGEAGNNKTRLYRVWANMLKRCSGENHKNYGGRGIKVCKAWRSFIAFRDWALAHGYRDDLQIDRIDNDGNYCPKNCRWVTCKANSRNTRRTRWETINGETKSLAEWCESYHMSYCVVHKRLGCGWELIDALTEPVKRMEVQHG